MVITIANQKGGVGKSTTAIALSSALREMGYKTLIIDSDQQCNITDTYKASVERTVTLYDLLIQGEETNINEAIQETKKGDIIAGDPLLREADNKLSNDISGKFKLSESLKTLNGYDFIIIDTAPATSEILYNCLIASDYILIPVTADRYSLQGLAQLNETVKAIKKHFNSKLKIIGLLLVKYNKRTIIAKEVREALKEIAEEMNTILFDTAIRTSTKVIEAQAKRTTLLEHAPQSTAAQDYRSFTEELLMEIAKNGKEQNK